MTEGLADRDGRATDRHERLYAAWSTGQPAAHWEYPDRPTVLERPGNVCADGAQSPEQRRRLRVHAAAATQGGNHCWAQISHAGRQCTTLVNKFPVGPSAVPVRALQGKSMRPMPLSECKQLVIKSGMLPECARSGPGCNCTHTVTCSQASCHCWQTSGQIATGQAHWKIEPTLVKCVGMSEMQLEMIFL